MQAVFLAHMTMSEYINHFKLQTKGLLFNTFVKSPKK